MFVVLFLLLICFSTVHNALPITSEQNEKVLLPNFVLGWTKTSTDYHFTLQLKGSPQTWIAIGTSQGTGIAGDVMTTNAAAVLGKPGSFGVGFSVAEYILQSKSIAGIVPFANSGPTPFQITSCVTKSCPDAANACQTRPSCVNALDCTANKVATTNSTSGLFVCTDIMGDGSDPDSVNSIGAFLDVAACFYQNCAIQLDATTKRETNIYSVTQSQVQETTTNSYTTQLSFSASKIGFVNLMESSNAVVTFIAAYGVSNILDDHGVNQRVAFTINLANNQNFVIATPTWVIAHAVLMTIGLGVVIPLGIISRLFHFRGHGVIQMAGIVIALTGVILGSFYVPNIGTDIHHVIGIVVTVLFILQPLTYFFRASETKASASAVNTTSIPQNLDKAALLQREDELNQRLLVWRYVHGGFGYLIIGLGVLAAFLGEKVLENSQVATLLPLPFIFAAFAGLTILVSIIQKIRERHLGKNRKFATEAPLTISSNPNFDKSALGLVLEGETEMEVDAVQPTFLVFKNVSYRVPLTKQDKKMGKTIGKLILSNVSGYCAPRSLTAIMGPSGSGKTSLLDLLASRARHPPEAGSNIEINGVPVHESTKILSKTSGYVLQEDILHQYLTVFETLMFTAKLVLVGSDQTRFDRVMRVIAQLGLGHAVDTRVGGADVRGLSGGERRRVSVGIQIIKSPSLLFLDEPTSGLDSSTAGKLVESLRDLANEGRTVVATIHQPGAQIFEYFDRLILLAQGKVVWSGSRTSAETFFASKNRPVPLKWNPADWFLLVVNAKRDQDEEEIDGEQGITIIQKNSPQKDKRKSYQIPSKPKGSTKVKLNVEALKINIAPESRNIDVSIFTEVAYKYYLQNNPEKLKNRPEIVDEIVRYGLVKGVSELEKKLIKTYGEGISSTLSLALQKGNFEPATKEELQNLINSFEKTPVYREIELRLKHCREDANASGTVVISTGKKQFSPEHQASLGIQIRILTQRGSLLSWRDPQVLRFQAIQNIVLGIVLGSLYSSLGNSQSRAYALSMAMVVILGIVCMITIALNTAVAFADKLVFEREQSDHLYSPVAHFFSRLFISLPISCIVAACLILPSYWWIGLRPGAQPFFFFFAVNLAMIFLFDGLSSVTVFLANDLPTAFGIGNFYEAIAIFMSGIFIPTNLIPPFWIWLYYITPFGYAYAAVAVNQFQGGEDEFWLSAIGIIWFSQWGNLLIVILMGILFRLLGLFLALRVNKKAMRNLQPKAA